MEPNTDEVQLTNVEVLEDGRFKVTAQLNSVGMTQIETRATNYEDVIYDGWCLVFGEDEDEHDNKNTNIYTDESPLIQLEPITANAKGEFSIIFDEYPCTSFVRLVVNMTDRENKTLNSMYSGSTTSSDTSGDVTYQSWRKACAASTGLDMDEPPTRYEVENYNIATFGQYRYQSVGLDGIYNMTYDTKAVMTYFTDTYQDLSGSATHYGIVFDTDGSDYKGTSSAGHGSPETYNKNIPSPANVNTSGFPMASYGFVLDAIDEENLLEIFENKVDMIRACSKVVVEVEDSGFTMSEVHLIDAAQEARIRSTVLATTGTGGTTSVQTSFAVPEDLGGVVTYSALTTSGTTSDPIYFYPNSGADYTYTGAVDQDVNPQYVVIKGQAAGYDTPGYYKVALKAKYPTAYEHDANGDIVVENGDKVVTDWTELTYDILRNTSFTIKLLGIDKPGYKTLEDAANENSPANNISYSITIETSDNRHEILVSKGTYYTELETSRVYVKGYVDEGIQGCYVDFTMTPSEGNYTPSVYVQSSDFDGDNYDGDGVVIKSCKVLYGEDTDWEGTDVVEFQLETNTTGDNLSEELIHITRSAVKSKVRVYFDVKSSGRIRLRIGDILKFIPVLYDPAPVSMYGTVNQDNQGEGLVVEDTTLGRSWSDFSYSEIEMYDRTDYADATDSNGDPADKDALGSFVLTKEGKIEHTTEGYYDYKPELRARIYPTDPGDGVAVLYLRQASDFRLLNSNGNEFDEGEDGAYSVEFTAQGNVWFNNTGELFSGEQGDDHITFDTGTVGSESVDALTISVNTVATGESVGDTQFFEETLTNNDQTLTLSIQEMNYSNQAYDEKPDDMITYNYTARSTITVENSAGDFKKYIVDQTQYPPIYIVANNSSTKSFSISGNPRNETDDEVCIYTIKIYGANYSEKSCTVSSDWALYSGTETNLTYFKTVMYESVLNSDYLRYYETNQEDYTQDGGWFEADYTFDRLVGYDYYVNRVSEPETTLTWTTLAELEKCSPDYDANACYILIRNSDVINGSSISADVTADVTISVVDKDHGDETYTSVKRLTGLD